MRCNKVERFRGCCSIIQFIEQRLGFLQIERVETFGEPAVDRGEKIAGLLLFTLVRQSRAMLIAARSSQDFACC